MNWIDFVILGVIGLSALISLIRGFVKEALSLVIWASAIFISNQYYEKLAVYFTKIEDDLFRKGAAVLVLIISTLIVGALLNYVISQLVQKTGLSGTDRILGIVFGALRGVLIVAAALFFVDVFTTIPGADWWRESVLIPEFSRIIEPFFEHLKETSSFLTNTI
ncbi:CvpA family protein [Vibrio hannami]|uniref:CvpA family protein n=1 Tax=Vibrio hannami TaxID=2717094 RepID=UPI0024104814|nr:CvpA family protein [Vibrio hannami]MDG3088692.1 CvpA family protein [Vibrio hannami]